MGGRGSRFDSTSEVGFGFPFLFSSLLFPFPFLSANFFSFVLFPSHASYSALLLFRVFIFSYVHMFICSYVHIFKTHHT
jgi:hypothetical protein